MGCGAIRKEIFTIISVRGTKLVAWVYNIAGNLWLEYKARVMLFPMTKALYYLYVSIFKNASSAQYGCFL